MMKERVVFNLDAFMARLARQGAIAFDDVEILAAIVEDQARQIAALRAQIDTEREVAIQALWLAGCYARDVALAVLDSAREMGDPTTTTTDTTGKRYDPFICAFCGQKRAWADMQAQFGDPPEFLCAPCYESVPAARWQEAYDRLAQKHRRS